MDPKGHFNFWRTYRECHALTLSSLSSCSNVEIISRATSMFIALSFVGRLIFTTQTPSSLLVVIIDMIGNELNVKLNVVYFPRTLPHWANADAAATQVLRSWKTGTLFFSINLIIFSVYGPPFPPHKIGFFFFFERAAK